MEPTRVFIHGLESSSQGTKGSFFRKRYPQMIIADFSGSFAERMENLEGLLAGKESLVIVGSSFGGLMAAAYAGLYEKRVKKLVLLAPALHLEPFNSLVPKKLPMPAVIYHGLRDEVVPMEAVRAVAAKIFVNHTFTVVDDDHSLHTTFASIDWDALLSVRE
jgi:pimeloyl-ACP methyl ester carboxylesterase